MSENKNIETKTEQVEKKEPYRIKVLEHASFDGNIKTNLISTIDMSDTISSLFATAFADYAGCDIRINNGNDAELFSDPMIPKYGIYVTLYFREHGNSNKPIKNLKRRGVAESKSATNEEGKATSNLAKRYAAVNETHNMNHNGRAYEVTSRTYEALDEFSYACTNKNGHVSNWGKYTKEISNNMNIIGSKEDVLVSITGLSLDKILTKIYGDKTEEGQFEYAATPSTAIPYRANQFIIQVSQLNKEIVSKLQRDLGVGSPTCGYGPQYPLK